MVEQEATSAERNDTSGVPSLGKCQFSYGAGMKKRWVESNSIFLDYIGGKFGQSVKASLQAGELIITEVDETLLPKFDTEAEMKAHVAALKYWEQEEYTQAKEDYQKFSRLVRQSLSTVYGTLMSVCDISLRSRLESEPEYQVMVQSNRYCAMKLYSLVKRNCNGSTYVMVDDVMGNLIEALYSVLLIRGDEYPNLPKYLEASDHKFVVLREALFDIANEELRDAYMTELDNRGQQSSGAYTKLKAWKDAGNSGAKKVAEKIGKKTLTDVFRARIYIKRAGSNYEQYRREVSNGYVSRSREAPYDIVEANRQMEFYRPVVQFKKKAEDERGSQHWTQGQGDRKFLCFRCERARPECAGVKKCEFETKADGSAVNTEDVIDKKFKELKDVLRRKKSTGGASHVITSEVIPTWDKLADEEKSHDGNLQMDWAFVQHGAQLEDTKDVDIDMDKKVIVYDISRQSDHVYNQNESSSRASSRKRWELLLDNQSTCDVIINRQLLRNIRKCKWTLRLQTQTGECVIDRVGDMMGVGTVWYYPQGVANILSQFRMVIYSKWRICYSTERYHETGDVSDLSYDVTTPDGFNCSFTPNSQGLHVYQVPKGRGTNVFGTKKKDNVTIFGGTCHAIIENSVSRSNTDDELDVTRSSDSSTGVVAGAEDEITGGRNNTQKSTGVITAQGQSVANKEGRKTVTWDDRINDREAIETVTGSRARFTKRDQLKADIVRRFQHVAAFPSDRTLMYSVVTNGIKNNPITKRDVELCTEMLGKSKYMAQGKTTMKGAEAVDKDAQLIELPPMVKLYYSDVELEADVLFVNDVPFLTTISRNIHYGTATAVDNLKLVTLEEGLRSVIRSYAVRGFHVVLICVDIQFKGIKDRNRLEVTVNIVSRG